MHQFHSLMRSSHSLLYGIPTKYINKLQRIQNSLARIVTRSKHFTSSIPILNDLHWLLVRFHIHFKIGLTVYKTINLKQPPSLSKHLTLRTIPNNLRSTNTTILNYGRFAKSSPHMHPGCGTHSLLPSVRQHLLPLFVNY